MRTCPECDADVDVTDGTAYAHGAENTVTIYCSQECCPDVE